MGKGTNVYNDDSDSNIRDLPQYSWEEVHRHTELQDRWIVIEDVVYNITEWQKRHPGGGKVLGHFAGHDATEAWRAFHNNKEFVRKFMKSYQIGTIKEKEVQLTNDKAKQQLKEDFEELRQTVWKTGLMKANPWFYIGHAVHVVVLEIVLWYFAWYLGFTYLNLFFVGFLMSIPQVQAGWVQHDYGHQSVFNNSRINHIIQTIAMGFLHGGPAHWWNFRHHQHHAKPNVFKKDPDITVPQLFLPGENIPRKWGTQKRGMAPYQYQDKYFWLLGPFGLIPVYFHFEISYFLLKRRDYFDALCMGLFTLRYLYFYYPLYGFFGCYCLYMAMRVFDSIWFVMVTQMSHLPMELDEEQHDDWTTGIAKSTTNVTGGFFNDWFTGHLNWQIEHHLFPSMPRHNYEKAAPLVKSLFKKHNLPYSCKTMSTAMGDIFKALRKSGQIWYEAYYHL